MLIKNQQLFHAARTGNIDLLQSVLSRGVDVNTRTDKGASALHHAAYAGQVQAMEVLLHRRADPAAVDQSNTQPIHWAIEGGRPESIDVLARHGVDVRALHDDTRTIYAESPYGPIAPIHWAAIHGQASCVTGLLRLGASVDDPTDQQNTALHFGVLHGSIEVVETLIAAGADVRARTTYGDTPLHMLGNRNRDVVVTTQDTDTRMIDALLQAGADPLLDNKAGLRPCEQADRALLAHIDQHILQGEAQPMRRTRRM